MCFVPVIGLGSNCLCQVFKLSAKSLACRMNRLREEARRARFEMRKSAAEYVLWGRADLPCALFTVRAVRFALDALLKSECPRCTVD